jgi:AraC family transcriptional regulator of adaptative response/methylated-DNA-[protein]-cysteine methyltransferase
MGDAPDALIDELRREFPDESPVYDAGGLDGIGAQVFTLADGGQTGVGLAVDMRGTRLQVRVWEALRAIPIGEIETYSQIARRIGVPGEGRAVARACLANRIALAIPCHRAIEDDGEVGEYRWGKERKRVLMNFEAHFRRVMP